MDLKRISFFILILSLYTAIAQEETPETQSRQINIVYGANFTKNESEYPGASIFSRDDERQVQFEHQGADLWCDIAIFYSKENRLRALGNVRLQQGDSIEMNSAKLDWNGNTSLAKAWENVDLSDGKMTLTTDTLYLTGKSRFPTITLEGRWSIRSMCSPAKLARTSPNLKKCSSKTKSI